MKSKCLYFWKKFHKELCIFSIDRIQKESDEFVSESQQLEREYEATIEQNEKKIKELTLANNRAYNEIESTRVSLPKKKVIKLYN
jgi:septal ring factor EnvC (AmiA/AmiB activator)